MDEREKLKETIRTKFLNDTDTDKLLRLIRNNNPPKTWLGLTKKDWAKFIAVCAGWALMLASILTALSMKQ